MWQDFNFGIRILAKNRAFTAIALLTLALGIGVNTSIFSVVSGILFHPLPYKDADRMVVVWESNPGMKLERVGVSGLNYLDWKQQTQTLEDLIAFEKGSGTVTGLGEPEQVPGMRVSVNFFEFLGIKAPMGRTFNADECQGQHNVGVISYNYWKSRLGGDLNVIGRQFAVDGLSYTIIGVLPRNFYFPVPGELFVPWPNEWLLRGGRDNHYLGVMGRLRPRVTLEQARADMRNISQRLAQLDPAQTGWTTRIEFTRETLVEGIKPALLALLGSVTVILLLACANVANLLLSRASSREKEIAIRLSMGARRSRLIRQLLTESLILAGAGGMLGIAVAYWSIELLRRLVPSRLQIPGGALEIELPSYGLNWEVLGYALIISLITGLVFGLVPAFHAARAPLNEILKAGGRDAAAASHRTRSLLVVSEVGLALLLLTGAGLMIRTFQRLISTSPGFQSGHLLTMQIEIPTDSKRQRAREQADFFHQVEREIARIPGVRSVGLNDCLPLDEDDERRVFEIEGRPPEAPGQQLQAPYRRINNAYFKAMSIQLLQGRTFTDFDHRESPPVAVIDNMMAKRFWPGENPVGKRLRIGSSGSPLTEIVGVVGSVKNYGLNKAMEPTIYVPFLQHPTPRMRFAIMANVDPASLSNAVKQAVWKVDSDQPVYKIRPMQELLDNSMAPQRLILSLLGIFSLLALLLAAIGIYGVMSYNVTQHTRDIGIRMALGAQTIDVLQMVLVQGLKVIAIGLAFGLLLSLTLTRFLTSLLYEVSVTDPLTFGIVVVSLLLVALLACLVPARRAMRVDPLVALRYE
jgi:putative ABC transport system permease protein